MSHQESFEITFKEGIYFLKGTLDEFSDLSILMSRNKIVASVRSSLSACIPSMEFHAR